MRVAVLGGGLQGACVAMELASAGISVDVYDKNDRCMSQASAQNEGKIHLGYVYANDRSLRTARTMVKGAITFASLMRRWIGDAVDQIPVSTPFYYAVHHDSLLSVEEIEQHFRRSHAIAMEESRSSVLDYFGGDYRTPPVRLSEGECGALFDRRRVAAAYRTAELSIDPEALAAIIRSCLSADPKIRCVLRTRVLGAMPDESGVTIDVEMAGCRSRERYNHVVNALWDGRLAVDLSAGIQPERPWQYRVKHFLRLRAPEMASSVPSSTVVLGPFGDVVVYGDGSLYLSWYPAGMVGASSDLTAPAWPLALDEAASGEMRKSILDGLRGIVPAVGRLTPNTVECCRVKAGIIVAWGQTDICDPVSGLHERHAIGPRSRGRYHSVDTGKLTMAPFVRKDGCRPNPASRVEAVTNSTHVTIGVPVYRGELFVEETLQSIQMQTHRDIEVVISLDGPDPGSEALCAPFLQDSRFRIVIQPERLGWVENINWLMAQATQRVLVLPPAGRPRRSAVCRTSARFRGTDAGSRGRLLRHRGLWPSSLETRSTFCYR